MAGANRRRTNPSDGRVVAVTGTGEFLGRTLVGRLESDPRYRRIWALDVRDPGRLGAKVLFQRLDLTLPEAGGELAALLRDEAVDTVVHLAFLSNPVHDATFAHELQVIGTLHVLNAAAAAGVSKLVMLGSTMSYGARPDNPAYLDEERALRGVPDCPFVADLVEAEGELARFADQNPRTVTTVLRLAGMLGAGVDTFMSRLLARRVVPTVLGYDPLMQFVHELDALEALKRAVDDDAPGSFNIAADGVLPLSTVLRLAARLPLPIPHPLAEWMGNLFWTLQAMSMPPAFLDYLRFGWVADNRRAKQRLGFQPKYTSRQALLNFVRLLALPPDLRAAGV